MEALSAASELPDSVVEQLLAMGDTIADTPSAGPPAGLVERIDRKSRARMCEDCGTKHASFSTPSERKPRWCGPCGKAHGAVLSYAKMCEGCDTKFASFGTPTERKARWCGPCGKAHGAVNLSAKICEDCNTKQASYGTADERKKRWCANCGKAHNAVPAVRKHRVDASKRPRGWAEKLAADAMGDMLGAAAAASPPAARAAAPSPADDAAPASMEFTPGDRAAKKQKATKRHHGKMCEGCDKKFASFGTPTERKARWCGPCGKAHGAVLPYAKMCEACGVKHASYGDRTERKKRWCASCGKAQNAVPTVVKQPSKAAEKRAADAMGDMILGCATAAPPDNATASPPAAAAAVDRGGGRGRGQPYQAWRNDPDWQKNMPGLSRKPPQTVPKKKVPRVCSLKKKEPEIKKMCDACGTKPATYGDYPDNARRLWCGVCSKAKNGQEATVAAKICESCGAKHAFLEPGFLHINDQFTKTGSGQTCGGNAEKERGMRFLLQGLSLRASARRWRVRYAGALAAGRRTAQ
jgi:hypothetical protein